MKHGRQTGVFICHQNSSEDEEENPEIGVELILSSPWMSLSEIEEEDDDEEVEEE